MGLWGQYQGCLNGSQCVSGGPKTGVLQGQGVSGVLQEERGCFESAPRRLMGVSGGFSGVLNTLRTFLGSQGVSEELQRALNAIQGVSEASHGAS